MKKLLVLFMFVFLSFPIFAQDDNNKQNGKENSQKIETLFGNDEFHSGGYGGPEIKFSPFKNAGKQKLGILVGGRGGWIVNSVFSIGGGGYGLVTSPEVYRKTSPLLGGRDSVYYLRMGYGGMFFEYINSSSSLFHFTVNCLIGAGGASTTLSMKDMMNQNGNYDNDHNWVEDASAFFIVEPGAMVEMNVTSFFRLGMGASYRFVSGLDMKNVTDSDLSNYSLNLIFKFGKF
ncbi:MAG: hypothetical protein WCT77_03690 [Bacteroidota bacterium]|jgi:hypothetical protein